MTGTDLCVNKSQFVPVIFEPPCTNSHHHAVQKKKETVEIQVQNVVRDLNFTTNAYRKSI
jgi:hypothetical protein